jgi:hypothetical protein
MRKVVTSKPDNLLSIFFVVFGSILAACLLFSFVSLLPLLAAIAACLLAIAALALAVYLLAKAGIMLWRYVANRQ